jgi:hypothetical protein
MFNESSQTFESAKDRAAFGPLSSLRRPLLPGEASDRDLIQRARLEFAPPPCTPPATPDLLPPTESIEFVPFTRTPLNVIAAVRHEQPSRIRASSLHVPRRGRSSAPARNMTIAELDWVPSGGKFQEILTRLRNRQTTASTPTNRAAALHTYLQLSARSSSQ